MFFEYPVNENSMIEWKECEIICGIVEKIMILVILPHILAAILKIEICDPQTTFHIELKRFKTLFIVHTNFLTSYI